MPLMSALSRHVFYPLWDLKDGKRRLHILRELNRTQWLPEATLRQRQHERLGWILRYAAANSPYYQRVFRERGFDPDEFSLAGFQALPLLTKALIRSSTDEILSREYPRSALGQHRTGGTTGVAL